MGGVDRRRVALGSGVTYEIWDDLREVTTVYPCGARVHASRELTVENLREALDQGYREPWSVWQSLVEHEALHTLVARYAFGRESYVLTHMAGLEETSNALRLHEEALVISLQRRMNGLPRDPVLKEYPGLELVGMTVRAMRLFDRNIDESTLARALRDEPTDR